MKKPLPEKILQTDYVQSAFRMPPALRDELRKSAAKHGRSMNAEILARLQATPDQAVIAELAALKKMIQRLLDRD
ncbi:plasmid stability protein [Duganella sp. 1224]|uniref:Arc family DNA-binding protein n=1 Tax=Duganella sp. 1224 TaxID=2587052 RepID=UPI0015CEE9C9|nr:Arc family DNA-binding protein [Duganella sp. 1224]NYE62209.1 plasmid stability protein [Duganella sp. 1224]